MTKAQSLFIVLLGLTLWGPMPSRADNDYELKVIGKIVDMDETSMRVESNQGRTLKISRQHPHDAAKLRAGSKVNWTVKTPHVLEIQEVQTIRHPHPGTGR